VGSTGLTTLAVGFDVLSASSTYPGPMIFSLTGYNTGIATTGGSSAERLASIEFNQGSAATSTFVPVRISRAISHRAPTPRTN
jgi:hypothetical protein